MEYEKLRGRWVFAATVVTASVAAKDFRYSVLALTPFIAEFVANRYTKLLDDTKGIAAPRKCSKMVMFRRRLASFIEPK